MSWITATSSTRRILHSESISTVAGCMLSYSIRLAPELLHTMLATLWPSFGIWRAVAEQANKDLAKSEFTARFSIGIDIGRCVAINNGSRLEQEPMFLGSAANHAAKLAESDQPGIFLSDRVLARLGLQRPGMHESLRSVDEAVVNQVIARRDVGTLSDPVTSPLARNPEKLVEIWQDEISKTEVPDPTIPRFKFYHKEPPLNEIKYPDLSPSNSIRMPLVSVFADLSGYTRYIDSAIEAGRIGDAVRALYVIRAEFQNVVERDFGGRKVRFIGDCIHALLAEGTRTETDDRESVIKSFECAGGLRSSFKICQNELSNLEILGLAIGIEYGPTPVTRVGIRGVRSVRLASSVATTVSEQMQRDCGDNETKFGPSAMAVIPAALHDLADGSGVAHDVTYDDVAVSLSAMHTPNLAPPYSRVHTPAHTGASRAHFRRV